MNIRLVVTILLVLALVTSTTTSYIDGMGGGGGKPKKPSLTVDNVTITTIEVSWAQATPPAVDGFRAEIREKVGGAPWVVDANLASNVFSHTYSGLTPDTTYEVQIVAHNGAGEAKSQKERTTLPMAPPPAGGTGKNGGGCDNCIAPSLGIQETTKIRVVSGGFTYNNQTVDVDYFRTPFPLVETEVGKNNTVTLKIYEDKGIQRIKHIAIAFGLDKDKPISNSKAYMEVDIDRGNLKLSTSGAVENVTVSSEVVSCGAINSNCFEITFYHMFTADASGIIGTYVWDTRLNAWQNFFNDGIDVYVEPVEFVEFVEIENVNEDIVIDRFGNFKRGSDKQIAYKQSQAEEAKEVFESRYGKIYNWD